MGYVWIFIEKWIILIEEVFGENEIFSNLKTFWTKNFGLNWLTLSGTAFLAFSGFCYSSWTDEKSMKLLFISWLLKLVGLELSTKRVTDFYKWTNDRNVVNVSLFWKLSLVDITFPHLINGTVTSNWNINAKCEWMQTFWDMVFFYGRSLQFEEDKIQTTSYLVTKAVSNCSNGSE